MTLGEFLSDPENLRGMSNDDALKFYHYLMTQGEQGQRAAEYFNSMYNSVKNNDQLDDDQDIADRNNDPIYQLAMGGGGALLGGTGMAAGESLIENGLPTFPSLFGGGNAATTALTMPNTVGMSTANGAVLTPVMNAGASGAGTAGATAGTGAATTGGMGALSTTGLVAAGVAGSIAGNELAEKYGGKWGDVGYNAAMAMNPVNQIYQPIEDMDNLMSGHDISLPTQVATALPTMGYSFLYNPVFGQGGKFGSGKGKDQLARDAFRDWAIENKVLPEDYTINFEDGGSFDFGLDGGAMLQNKGTDGMPSGYRHYYDVDWSDPNAGETVGSLDPLLSAMPGIDEKLGGDVIGYGYNAVSGGGDSNQRRSQIYGAVYGSGTTGRDRAYNAVLADYDAGNLTQEQRNARLAAVDKQYGVINPGAGKGGEAEYGINYIKPGDEKKKKNGYA